MIKIVKDAQGNLISYGPDDENYDPTIPEGCALEIVSEEEAAILNAPLPLTMAGKVELVRQALQDAIDIKAKALSFSSGNALMLYAGFTNPFQIIAQGFAVWEASVWFEAEQYKAQVIAGNQPMLTPEQAVAMMPTYP